MPDLAGRLARLESAWGDPEKRQGVLAEVWPGIEPQPIDRGIMERADRVAVIPAQELGWSDVGNWDTFFELMPPDENGNLVLEGETCLMETSDSLVYAQNKQRLVAMIGVEDLIVVDTPDALLVCDRRKVQKIRELVEVLRQSGKIDYL